MESRDDWGDHRDEELDAEYPAAPTPPHERLWRHPSELAASTVTEMPTTTAVGRGFFVLTGVAAIALAFGLVQLLSSEPRNSVISDGASSVNSVETATTGGTFPSSSASVLAASSTAAAPTTTSGPTGASASPAPPNTLLTSLGRSAIVWADGTWAVTTADGLALGQTTDVTLPDGTSRVASVLAVDDETGLALLALADPSGTMPPAPDVASLPAAGATVLAIALDGTSVSATLVAESNELLVQPDGPAELNDGAPLTDQNGAVVGLCSRSADGRTRALDLSSVRELVKALPGGWIGVSGRLDRDGVEVVHVVPGSPAEAAGLLAGDVIALVDGEPVSELDRFSREIRRRSPGSTMVITARRGDETLELAVTVGDRLDYQASTSTTEVVTVTVATTTSVEPSATPPSTAEPSATRPATTQLATTRPATTQPATTTSAVTVPDESSAPVSPAPPTTRET
ncbi:MAG TPA: PDZ domain-containing protein [Ilumatobacteraceae bacterium]